MSDDYGKKISQALAAVRRMHADVSRLLVDADRTIGQGKDSLFGNYATRWLTYNVKADYWMAWFVFRYYPASDDSEPGLVDAISVWFFDNQSRIAEPHLLLGQICYDQPAEQTSKPACQETDLVHAYLLWSGQPISDTVLSGIQPPQKSSVRWFKVIAVPLYSITSMEDVMRLMGRVRTAEVPVPKLG